MCGDNKFIIIPIQRRTTHISCRLFTFINVYVKRTKLSTKTEISDAHIHIQQLNQFAYQES